MSHGTFYLIRFLDGNHAFHTTDREEAEINFEASDNLPLEAWQIDGDGELINVTEDFREEAERIRDRKERGYVDPYSSLRFGNEDYGVGRVA